MKTLEHIRYLSLHYNNQPKKGRYKLVSEDKEILAIICNLVAPVFRDDQFLGFYEKEEPIFIAKNDGDYYFALDKFGEKIRHPHVHPEDGLICFGNNTKDIKGAVFSLLVINAKSVYFMPMLSFEPKQQPDETKVYYL
jgi:hypothetical protein